MAGFTGSVMNVVDRALLTRANVSAARRLGEKFRLIELEGPELRGAKWKPGDKIQVRVGTLTVRTYTPVFWDRMTGRMSLLVYLHGNGPGSEWAESARAGMPCAFWGPSRAVDLSAVDGPVVLFGDETSIGTFAALKAVRPGAGDRFIAEVSSAGDVRQALDHFGLPGVIRWRKGPAGRRTPSGPSAPPTARSGPSASSSQAG